jgi:hypothetical protein
VAGRPTNKKHSNRANQDVPRCAKMCQVFVDVNIVQLVDNGLIRAVLFENYCWAINFNFPTLARMGNVVISFKVILAKIKFRPGMQTRICAV